MKQKDFKLKPEMQNEAELYWICGNLFGWQEVKETKYIMEKDNNGSPIKIQSEEEVEHAKYIRIMNKGKYYFWNEDGKSKGTDGKWVEFDKNAMRRDQAFNLFKTMILPQIKNTLHEKIKKDIQNRGKGYYDGIIDNIIANGKFDYIDQIICANKNSLTFYKQGNEGERLDEEWTYIEKQLKNALGNFKI
ncbi:MAG: hypothetical protein LBM67_05000 [Lentimicrobiaceae bacterium]|jgi:hypothetical protein|nr:hypothetical protein [Lentimicrobiaceae bacterium]